MFFIHSNTFTSEVSQVFQLMYSWEVLEFFVSGFVYLWLYFHQENFSYSTNMQQCREV